MTRNIVQGRFRAGINSESPDVVVIYQDEVWPVACHVNDFKDLVDVVNQAYAAFVESVDIVTEP